jgi:hypothetical protein
MWSLSFQKKGVKSMEQVSLDKDYLRDLPADNGG